MKFRSSTGIPAWIPAVTAMLLIQVSNALSVTVIDEVGAAGTAWLRMLFGGALLLLIVRPRFSTIRRADVPLLLVLGLATGLMSIFFLAAVERIPLGTAVAIEFLGPLAVAAFTGRGRSKLVWPIVAFIGVVLLTEPWQGRIDFLGVVFALLAAVCWGLYNVYTQRVGDRFTGISALALTIPIAMLFTAPAGLPQVIQGNAAIWVLALAAGIALLSPVVSFALEMIALRRMTHTAFGTLLAIEPAFAALAGLLLLSQAPSAMQLMGLTLVVFAGAAAQRGGTRPPPVESADSVQQPIHEHDRTEK
ncbi:MAG: EamA family transporter [Gulosibacter sp.]|uniref:EamA family transporter n=1 Tax=Gulosibacter sp. TaxID=2817531 RepID=UPI003F91D4D6